MRKKLRAYKKHAGKPCRAQHTATFWRQQVKNLVLQRRTGLTRVRLAPSWPPCSAGISMLSSSAGMYGGLEISHVASVAAAPLKKQLLCTCAQPDFQHVVVNCQSMGSQQVTTWRQDTISMLCNSHHIPMYSCLHALLKRPRLARHNRYISILNTACTPLTQGHYAPCTGGAPPCPSRCASPPPPPWR
jgi:hypothetical protein